MFRTRDFILIFTAVFFLVIAIGVTSLHQFLSSPASTNGELRPSDYVIEEYTVSTDHSETSRDATITALRDKIAKSNSVIKMPEPIATATADEDDSDVDEEVVTDDVQLCTEFQTVTSVAWVPQDTYWQQAEGARILYERPYVEAKVTSTTSSSSVPISDIARVQLPIISLPTSNPSCIKTDVVGIALDGSLIRNNEAGLYSVFGAETIIGYALDGFPIHGLGNERSDNCGGRIVSGQYRYELSSERQNVINCYASTPQSLSYGNAGF